MYCPTHNVGYPTLQCQETYNDKWWLSYMSMGDRIRERRKN